MPALLRNCANFCLRVAVSFVFLFLLAISARAQQTINVPANQPTIQAAINAANNGDTVLVAPGTYVENINFNGKAITVTSSAGPTSTIIDGNASGSVVTFATNETTASVLGGFTIRNGLQDGFWGAGISITSASPTITGNVITGNHAAVGIGIYIDGGSAIIKNNTITGNNQNGAGDGGQGGGGVYVGGSSTTPSAPQIIGNTITNNSVAGGGVGGGVSVGYFSSPTIEGNLIEGNSAYNGGGGIALESYNSPVVVQNVIAGNTSGPGGSGGGMYVSPGSAAQYIVNNTIVGNSAYDSSSGIFSTGLGQNATYINNIIVATPGQGSVLCSFMYSQTSPLFSYNDAFDGPGLGWPIGNCDSTMLPGNISSDPLFINPGNSDYHLQAASPAIDAGSNSAPDLPQTDYDGNPRITDGNNDGVATIDLGAFERVTTSAANIAPNALTFSPQLIGATSGSQSTILTSTGTTPFQITSVQVGGDFAQTSSCSAAVPSGTSCSYNITFVPTAAGPRTGTMTLGSTNGQILLVSLTGTGISPAQTTTAVASSNNPSTAQQSVTFTANVQISSGSGPTGTVTFFDGVTPLGTSVLSGSSAQFVTSALTPGSHSITAVYSGDVNFAGSTSPVLTQTVNAIQTTTTVTSNSNPSSTGQSIAFTANVRISSGSGPTGTVTFMDGVTPLGTSVLSDFSAQFVTSALIPGSHSITAIYSGDVNFAFSKSSVLTQTVNGIPTTTTVTSNINPSTSGQTLIFTANVHVSSGGSPTGAVYFFDGATMIGAGSMSASSAEFAISYLSVGTHNITAQYLGDATFGGSTSPTLAQTINLVGTTTAIVSNNNPSTFGQNVTFTASVTFSSSASGGAVTFFDGAAALGTVNFSGSTAQFSTSVLADGAHSITAKYVGNSSIASSTSPVLTETVNPIQTATTVSSNGNPSTFGQSVTFTTNVQVSSGSGATGTVAFFDGATALGSSNLSNASAQLSISSLAVGSHSITARYSGDANFAGSTSSVLTQTVSAAVPQGLAIDAQVSVNPSSPSPTVKSAAFSTTSGNELLLAFVATDYVSGANTTVTGVAGGGLTWALVVRTNTQSGSSEIWRAFATAPLSGATVTATLSQSVISSLSVISFTGVDTSGAGGSGAIGATKSANAGSGAPTATLVTTRNNSWVFGVANDFDNAIARTLGPGQTLINQYLTPTGDTYWMQRQTNPTPLSGTSVTLNDTAPTGDRYNLSLVEVLPPAVVVPTYSVSGNVAPAANGTGTKLTLSGAATGSMTADASGNFTFTNLPNGSYTITPSKTGFTFTPASQPVTVSSANVTSVNFTIQAVPTYSISGTITPAALGSGVALTLSGAATASTTADGSGNYSFAGLLNGSYTVTPSKNGESFTPSSLLVTISNANAPNSNLTAQTVTATSIAIDATAAGDQSSASTTVTSAAFSTNSTNELLLAFVSSDDPGTGANIVVNGVSGAGMTWTLVARSNIQSGTAEIWRAFSPTLLTNVTVTASLSKSATSSVVVMTYSGVSVSGTGGSGAIGAIKTTNANPGAPSGSLVTTKNGSLVVGVGIDYDNPITRTLGPGQTLVHQYLSPVGDTYWVQRQSAVTPASGTTVTINDTAPTGDRYNLAICEVLPAQ